jgi:hypothetical protein
MTHTYALLEVLPSTFHDVRKRLEQADYGHAFHDNAIDMHGIALTEIKRPPYEGENLYAKINRGDFDFPVDNAGEVDTTIMESFKRAALHRTGLIDHPKADEIFDFCSIQAVHADEQVGRQYQTKLVRLLETIASFMQ